MRPRLARTVALCLALLASWPGGAWAADWSGAFPADVLERHLPRGPVHVEPPAEGAPADWLDAADALRVALRQAGYPVVGPDHPGAVRLRLTAAEPASDPADPAAVAVAVVVADAPDGGAPWIVTPRPPLPANLPTGLLSPIAPEGRPLTDAERAFNDRFVGFVTGTDLGPDGSVLATWNKPFRGVQRTPLPGPDFYEAIDRPDLARVYRRRATTRTVLLTLGGSTAVAGGLVLFAPLLDPDLQPGELETSLVVGLLLTAGGSVITLVGRNTRPHPVNGQQARELARSHNHRLRIDLGLAPLGGRQGLTGAGVVVGGDLR